VPPADDEKRARWRRRVRPVMLVVGAILTAANLWVCNQREQEKEKLGERRGFEQYMRTTNKKLETQADSVRSGLAGLVIETAPRTAQGALDRLDKEIIPNLEWIADEGRGIVPEGEPARLLHSEYLRAIAATREDAARLRVIFADGALTLAEQRQKAREVLVGTRERFQTFEQHVVETAARVGTVITAPPAPAPTKL